MIPKDKTFRTSVLASVVAAILVIIFIEPILGWIWRLTFSGTTFTFGWFTDRIYQNAALGVRNWVLQGFLSIGFFFFAISSVLRPIVRLYFPQEDSKDATADDYTEKKRRPQPVLRIGLRTIGFIGAIYLSVSIFADLQLNTSFNQRMTVLAPHLSQEEEEELRAQWALMRSREDYTEVQDLIENKAAKLEIALPASLPGG